MPASPRTIIAAAAILGALGVACGAFGAHALKDRVAPELLGVWQTAVHYHVWHALGLLAVGLLALQLPQQQPWITACAILLLAGIVLFSGSLYALALGAPRTFGIFTPFGGLSLIGGWLCLVVAVVRA